MASVAVYTQDLHQFTAERATRVNQRMQGEAGTSLECVYGLVWPDYEPPATPHPQQNRAAFRSWADQTAVPLWGWFNASADQAADVAVLGRLTAELEPEGWLLDIEGEWTKNAKLKTLLGGAVALGRRVRASIAGLTPSHVEYDYRELDRQGIDIDWQAYFDSGEGCTPDVAVAELYRSTFVVPGWEYRHHIRGVYGWGKPTGVKLTDRTQMQFDSYMKPGSPNATFKVATRAWGWSVADGRLVQTATIIGQLMGRARYSMIRVALDVTRGAADKHTLREWTQIAASATVPGTKRRPISVYLGEACSDDVLIAIAKGAA
jgi:hypothetical protein